jgi:hypothetical protein
MMKDCRHYRLWIASGLSTSLLQAISVINIHHHEDVTIARYHTDHSLLLARCMIVFR